MNIRSFLIAKWPELLALGSLALIGLFILDRFFPSVLRHPHRVVHLSCFAYRDVNRNGVYDMGDRPYAGLNVTIERPKGGPVQRPSNIAGFANFDMSEGNRKADVYLPGEYTVRIQPPPEWDVTSSNTTQKITLEKRDGSAVGLIMVRTIDAVGVAPRLKISGSIEPSLKSANLKATDPEGREAVVNVSKEGTFSLPATRGLWRFECVLSNGTSFFRNVSVDTYPVVLSELRPPGQPSSPKQKLKVIAFDNLTVSDTLCEIPNGYEGLNWRNWVATHQKLYEGDGFVNAATSSEYVAYTSAGHPATTSSPTPFDFVGANVTAAWPGGEQYNVVVKAWRNETEVYRDTFKATTAGPTYFDADYKNITRIEFASEGYWQIVMDDFVCRTE